MLLDTRALRLHASEQKAWKAVVQAALQAEAAVLTFVVVGWLILGALHADFTRIGKWPSK